MNTQRLEGSRFGMYPATLPTFPSYLVPPKRCEKQAAPANVCSRRNSITAYNGLKKSHDNSSRWVILGSRLLNQFHVRIETGNKYARLRVSRLSGSPTGDGHSRVTHRKPNRGQPARHGLPEFQTMGRSREDDDEYENDALSDVLLAPEF